MTDLYLHVNSPLRYLDGEMNAVHKDFDKAEVKIALAFPDLYELGMSHLGLKILYEILNAREEYVAERVFTPWPDRGDQLRKEGLPLTSLESDRPLVDFDMIGFTLPYELSCTNILETLDLGGIPLMAAERGDDHPLVAGGGPGTFNPEPLADFFDFFLLGDGEEAISEIADTIKECRSESRRDTLARIARIGGVYVPLFFQPPGGSEKGTCVEAVDGQPSPIKKRILLDLDSVPYPVRPPVPYLESTHDRVTIEIARGCIQRCRFCQAGTTYRPYRERSPATIIAMARENLENTGYDELSLAALSCGDYGRLEEVLSELMARHGDRRVSISLPSLRPGTVTPGVLKEIKKVKRTGFTIAPEAGTQRLRDVVSKGITEEEIMETCTRLFTEGWNRIKLYFMIGLPTETHEDRQGIVDLVGRIRALGKRILGRMPVLGVSVSSFVPKPHTPFQWAPQLPPSELYPILDSLRAQLKKKGATFKWHKPELSALEGAISRGDRRLSAVIRRAWEKGCRFDGWTEHFSFEPWEEAFREHDFDLFEMIGSPHDLDDRLPWDHLCPADLKEFLVEERRLSLETTPSEACDPSACPSCGLCEDYPAGGEEDAPPVEPRPKEAFQKAGVGVKVRLEFAKFGRMRYLPHLSLIRTFQRAFRRAGIPLAYSQGFHPHPRMQAGPPLPMGYGGENEYLDVEIEALMSPLEIVQGLSSRLPDGLEVKRAVAIAGKVPSLFDVINLQKYRVTLLKERLPEKDPGNWIIGCILNAEELAMTRTRKGKTKRLDLRPFVAGVELIGEDEKEIELMITLRRDKGSSARPGDVLRIAGGFAPEEEFTWKITRTANIIVQNDRQLSPIEATARQTGKKTLSCRR